MRTNERETKHIFSRHVLMILSLLLCQSYELALVKQGAEQKAMKLVPAIMDVSWIYICLAPTAATIFIAGSLA